MIYDCFTFFNELDILELRLNILNDYVDKFVIVEATRTFRNKNRECVFEENKSRFEKFLSKIIYIKLDDYPQNITKWTIENHQRNAIMRGLEKCKDDDIILISDLDEIPNPEFIKDHFRPDKIVCFQMKVFNYFLNNYTMGLKWHGTKMLTFKNLKNILNDYKYPKTFGIQDDINDGTTPCKVRLYRGNKQEVIENSGWHFSYIGGKQLVIDKMRSFSEAVDTFSEKDYQRALKSKFYGEYYMIPVKIDDTFPRYLIENIEKYSEFILKDNLKDINSKALNIFYKFRSFLDELLSVCFVSKNNKTRVIVKILGIKMSFAIRSLDTHQIQ